MSYRTPAPYKPRAPRKQTVRRYKSVERTRSVARNVEAIYAAAQTVHKETGLPLKDIKHDIEYYDRSRLVWYTPETDEEFSRRQARAERVYKDARNEYEKDKRRYDEWLAAESLGGIGKAVKDHEAAINTIAEVLKKYPDVLDKAVAKAVKGK